MAGPKLIVLSEQLRGKSFELNKDLHTCGRIEERDVCIKDPTISTYHCEFIKSGTTYILKDNNSTNGTRVNNVPVTEQELQNSDILQLGGVEILYDCDDKSVTTVMRTHTGIDFDGSDIQVATVNKMENFDPFKREGTGGKGGATQKIVLSLVILLVLIILALLGVLVFFLFGQDGGGPPA